MYDKVKSLESIREVIGYLYLLSPLVYLNR